MQFDHVLRQGLVFLGVQDVTHQEYRIEAGKESRLEVDLVRYLGEVVLTTHIGVGSSQYAASGVEERSDACLSDGYRLLLHGLVDSHSVLSLHLIELINADRASVAQHQRARLQLELSRSGVLQH